KIKEAIVDGTDFKFNTNEATLTLGESINLVAQIDNIAIDNQKLSKKIIPLIPQSIRLDVDLIDSGFSINEFKVNNGLTQATGSGNIGLKMGVVIFDQFKINLSGADDEIWSLFPIEESNLYDGHYEIEAIATGSIEKIKIDTKLKVENLKSPFANADELKIDAQYDNEVVTVSWAQVKMGTGIVSTKSQPIFKIKEPKFYERIDPIDIHLNEVKTNDLFHFLGDTLDPLQAKISGNVRVGYQKNKLNIESLERISLQQLKVNLASNEPLLAHSLMNLSKLKINLALSPLNLTLESMLSFEESEANVYLELDDVGLSAKLKSTNFIFNNLKKIQGVELLGAGALALEVKGPWNDIVFDINGSLENSFVAGYNLGKISFDAKLPVKKSEILFSNIKGSRGFSRYVGNVRLALAKVPYPLKIDFNADRATFADLKEIIKPIVPESVYKLRELQARFETAGNLNIDFDGRPT